MFTYPIIEAAGASAPELLDTTQGNSNGSSFDSSFTIAYPATVNADDLLVAWVVGKNGVDKFTTPAGWFRAEGVNYVGSDLMGDCFFKIADGTETGNVTFATEGGTGRLSGFIWRVEGADTWAPIIDIAAVTNDSPSSPDTISGVTTPGDCLILAGAGIDCGSAGTVSTATSGWVVDDHKDEDTGSFFHESAVLHGEGIAAGAASVDVTYTAGTPAVFIGIIMVIAPVGHSTPETGAITVIDDTTAETTSATSISIPAPTDINPGDIIVVTLSTETSINAVLEGFEDEVSVAAFDCRSRLWWRRACHEAKGFTITGLSTADDIGWIIVLRGGFDYDNLIDVTSTATQNGGGNPALPFPGGQVTTTVNNCFVISHMAHDGGDGHAFAVTGSGWTLGDTEGTSGDNSGISGAWATKTVATAGASGAADFEGGSSDGNTGVAVAFTPG